MEREELAAWLRLTLAPGIGNETARKLLRSFGLPAAIFRQTPTVLQQVVSPVQSEALRNEPPELASQTQATWAWLQEEPSTRQIVVLGDPGYPASLLTIDDPPLLLYLMGRLDLPIESSTSLAILFNYLHLVTSFCQSQGSSKSTNSGTNNKNTLLHYCFFNFLRNCGYNSSLTHVNPGSNFSISSYINFAFIFSSIAS